MKDKVMTFITVFLCVLAVGALSYAGFVTFRFVSSYKVLFTENISEEEVTALNQESKQIAQKLSANEQQLQELVQRKELLASVEEDNHEQEIRNCYIAKKEAESAARSLILSKLQNASYITIPVAEQEKFGDVVLDKVIDEATGNAIVSAGVKSAISAASEDMSLNHIINGAIDGAIAEIPNYVEGEITGFVGDIVGFDIFGVASWISDFMNPDDTPVALANSMVTEQRKDVAYVLALLEKEELTAADMQYMAGLMERIRIRGEELVAAGSSVGGNFSGAEELQELARLWEKNNYSILQYAELEGVSNEN